MYGSDIFFKDHFCFTATIILKALLLVLVLMSKQLVNGFNVSPVLVHL